METNETALSSVSDPLSTNPTLVFGPRPKRKVANESAFTLIYPCPPVDSPEIELGDSLTEVSFRRFLTKLLLKDCSSRSLELSVSFGAPRTQRTRTGSRRVSQSDVGDPLAQITHPMMVAAVFQVYSHSQTCWQRIGQTEILTGFGEFDFSTKLTVELDNEADQQRRFRLAILEESTAGFAEGKESATCFVEFNVGDILRSKNLEYIQELIDPVCSFQALRITGDVIDSQGTSSFMDSPASFTMNIPKVLRGNARMYYVMKRERVCGDNTFTTVYRSEVLAENEVIFESLFRRVRGLSGGLLDRRLRIELYEETRGSAFCHGYIQFTMEQLLSIEETDPPLELLWWPMHRLGHCRTPEKIRGWVLTSAIIDEKGVYNFFIRAAGSRRVAGSRHVAGSGRATGGESRQPRRRLALKYSKHRSTKT